MLDSGQALLAIFNADTPPDVRFFSTPSESPNQEGISLLATEYRWQCADGAYRWFLDQASLQRDAQGRPAMIVGTWQDITESKRAQTALFQLSGRILHLQDDERRRIARELHDSTAQDLAALSMNLAILERSLTGLSPISHKALMDSVNLTQQASREIRTLSYLLHPPLLDEAGLASALGWYVDGFVQRAVLTRRLVQQ